MSSKYPTVLDCLRNLGQRIQSEHDPTCVAPVQKLQAVDEDVTSTKRPSDEGTVSLNAIVLQQDQSKTLYFKVYLNPVKSKPSKVSTLRW